MSKQEINQIPIALAQSMERGIFFAFTLNCERSPL